MHDLTEHGRSVLRYKGPNGRLRVSAHYLDEELTNDIIPAHSFDRVEKLQPGEIAEIEVDMFPIGMVFYPGEQLRLVISSQRSGSYHAWNICICSRKQEETYYPYRWNKSLLSSDPC